MEEESGIFGPVNLGAKPLDLVRTPATNVAGKPESAIDTFYKVMRQSAPQQGQTFSYVDTRNLDLSGRYPRVYQTLDNENFYAKQQGTLEKLGNGVAKFAGIAASTFVNTTAGLVYGIGDWARTGEFNAMFDNDLTRELNSFNNEYLETTFANYKTQRERDGNWWEPENLFTANFLADNIIKNLGFAAGAIAGGFGWTGVLRAIGLTGRLIAQGRTMAAATDAAIASANVVPQAQRLSAINSALNGLGASTRAAAGRALMGSERAIVSTFGAAGEAGIEALNASQEFRQSLIDKFIAEKGYVPSGQDLANIDKLSEDAGKTVYGLNIGLLSVSNFIQLPKIFSSTFKGEKSIVNDIAFRGGKYVSTLPEKGIAKTLYKARNIAGLAFNTTEALEEVSQYAVQVGTENYFSKLDETGDASILDDLFFNGAREALSSDEGLLNLFIGGVSGAIMTSGVPTLGMTGEIKERGLTGYGGQQKKLRDEAISVFNSSLIKDKLKDSAKIINASERIQQERAQKIAEGDISAAKDLEFDFLFGTVLNRAKYTSTEFIDQELQELKSLANTEEGFLQLQQEGYAYSTDTRESFLRRLNTIESQAKYIDKAYQDINLKYKGVLDKNGKRLYSNEVIDKLTYAASKIFDYDTRIPSLNNKLIAAGINTAEVFNDVLLNGKPATEAVDSALADIRSKGSVNEDELTQDLFELVEMGMKRKKFIDEYKQIKENPSNFTSAEKESDTVIPEENIGNTVNVKTKSGEKQVLVGEEYSLGAPVDFQKDGFDLEVKSYNITVLGENEDGTIKIKTASGKERDVSKEEFVKYNLIPISEIQSNKTAKYYDIHKNEIFEYNFGKDFGGKKQGRIEYRNGNLYFKYKDSKGNIKEKKLDRSHFVAKEGYDNARISIVGKVATAAQKQAESEFLEQQKLEEDVNKAQENRAKRIEILSELIEETKQEQEQLDSLIAKKKNELQSISKELEELEEKILSTTDDKDLRYKKQVKFKSSTRKALAAANRLSKLKEDLENEIPKLEARREDIEIDFSYLSDMAQNIEELPGASNEFLKELREHVSFVKDLIEEKEKQISEINGILPKVQEALDSAINFLSDLVSEFQKRFPKAPLALGQEWIDFLQANPNFLKKKPNYTQELKQLEEMVAQVEDLDIEPGERTINELNKNLKDLESDLSDLKNQLKSTEFVLSKFEDIARLYLEQKAEEEKMLANDKLKKQILGTADSSNAVAPVFDREYEVDAKKPVAIIPRATLATNRAKPHQNRAQRFGMNFQSFDNDQKKNIKGVYITSKNQDQLIPGLMDFLRTDENGINETVDPNRIIAMVMVDMSTGRPVLIGENGQPLTEEQLQDPLNNAIYQVFPLETLKWSGDYGDKSMFANNVPENVRSEVTKQYAEWRSRILKVEDLSEVHSIDVSFGIPKVNEDTEGNKLYDTRTGVEEAGLVTDYEIDNSPIITIATSDESIIRGISVTKSSPGRVFLDMGNGLVPLNNRQHTKKEAETIFNAILQFSKNAFDRKKGVNDDQSKRLISYLKSVVYWGIPANENSLKPPGYSSVFFKDGKLFMSGRGESFPFTPSGLLQNKDSIITVLTGMYHNVNGAIAREVGQEYEQITNISEDGTIESVMWPNYQSYLLSTTTPDGKKRSGEELPLSTYMRPLEGPNDVNRSGIYFYTTDTVDDYIIPETKRELKITPAVTKVPQTKFVLDGETPNELKSEKTGRVILFAAPSQNPTLDNIQIFRSDDLNDVIAEFESKGEDPGVAIKQMVLKAVQKQIQSKQELPTSSKAEKGRAKLFGSEKPLAPAQAAAPTPAVPEVAKVTIQMQPANIEKIKAGTKTTTTRSESQAKEINIPVGESAIVNFGGQDFKVTNRGQLTIEEAGGKEAMIKSEGVQSEEEFMYKQTKDWVNGKGKLYVYDIVSTKTPTSETPKAADKGRARLFGQTPTTTNIKDEANQLSEDLDNKIKTTKRSNRADFRLVVEKQAKSGMTEDWNEIEAFWKRVLPNVPLYRLKNIIQATNGVQAWGMLKNGAIYVYENAEVGTFYHEVFEAVWKMFADPAEQQSIINEFKSRTGTFVDRPTGETVKYSEATPQQIKEQLAEEFREYVLFKKVPAKPKDGRPFIVKLFSDIVNIIKKFFTGKDANINTEELFKRIGSGYYAKSIPSMGVLEDIPTQIIDIEDAFATEEDELRAITLPYVQLHEVIQHMTYRTLSLLGLNDQSLFNVTNLNKQNLNDVLFEEIVGEIDEDGVFVKPGIIAELMDANKDNWKEGKISDAEFVALNKSLEQTLKKVINEWEDIFSKYEEYMKQYQIEFDENDQLQLTDEDKTREINQDATKIDAFRKANSAIKILLATLPRTKVVNGKVETIVTSVGGNELLPLSQTFVTVLNKLYSSRDVNEMMENLRQLAIEDSNYIKLYERIAKKPPLSKEGEDRFEFKKLTTPHSLQLLSSFFTTFKKQNPEVKNVFILENGDVVVGDANLSQASSQIADDFENGIIMSARQGTGYLEYSQERKAYVAKDKINDLKFNSSNIADNDNAMLRFLNDISIEFTKEDFKKLDRDDKTKFREVVKGIRDSLVKNKELMTLSKKTISIQGRLTELALLKVKVSNPEIDITYFNISNERTQSYIGVNPLSDLQDFIAKTKNLGDNSVKESHYKYLVKDPFAKGSVILNKLFPKGGKKVPSSNANSKLLTVGYVSGTKNDENGKQKPSARLTYPERLVQEINLNLDGFYLNLVPGDASIEWMVKMGNHVSSTDMSKDYGKVMEIFKEYFKAEYELAKSPDRFVDPSRESERNNLRFFYDILGKKLNDKIIASTEVDAEAVYNKFESDIETAVKNYIESKSDSFRSTLSTYNILQYDGQSFSLNNIKTSEGGMYTLSKSMNEQTLNNNLRALTVNYMIANIELHKLMYSDPYQYKDELKRIKSFSSPRQAIMSDPDSLTVGFNINAAMHNVLNEGFKKGDPGYTDLNRNYFRTVTHADVIGIVDVPGKDYDAFKETDGSGIISLKAHRNLKFRAGQWTDENELQYRHDVAYEELVKSGADQATIDEFDKNNPGVQSTYTPVKPIVAGTTDNEQGYNEVVLDKFALYPLSFRVMHKINPTSNAMKLYDKMQREDIDYIVFNSGRKVGARNPHSTYNADGSFNNASYIVEGNDRNVINIPFKIMAIQAEVPSKDKALVTRGSQITKLLTMDFMAAGVPVDFMPNESNFNKRYQAWNALDEEGKEQSKLYKEIKNNRELLQEMTKFGYQILLRRLGIEIVDGKHKIVDFSVAATTLRDEILKREVNDNVIESLDSFLKGKTTLEATPAYQQVRNILYSIVDSEITSPKISGGMKVQIPSTLLESNKIAIQEINGKKGFVSDTLKFYEKDGERVAEVMIGRWFDSPLSDEELMDYFNNDPEGKKQMAALFGVAFRIPTQNQNSIDAIKIAKFLPKEFGDSVVIPSALVAKVGSDFDIDKLSMYLKNVYTDAKGNIKLVPFEGYGQQAIDKFKDLSRELTQAKIEKVENKILKQEDLRQTFVDIVTENTSNEFAQIWIPLFRQWFANEIVDGKLSVELVGDVFAKRFEKLNKKLEKLTLRDLQDAFVEEHAERLYKASLENAYIQSSENLIKSDENYDKLMTPNSAEQLKKLADIIAKKTVGQSYDYKNVGNMLDRNFMSSLRHAFVTGKYAIGIAAVNQTNHSLMQRFASYVDPARLSNVSKVDRKWLGDAKVKFQQFNKFDGKATMSMIKNADGKFISDIIGQFIDGYVDISNGPWIMQLGATPNVASTWLFLVKIGVPIDTVTYFMNQPIVRDYLQAIENAGYSWLFIDDFVASVSQDYASGKKAAPRNEIPNTKSLSDMVGKKPSDLSPDQKADQQFILGEFLKYAKMAEHMFLVTQGTNYDTSNFNDPNLLYKKYEQFKKAQKTIISSVDEILDNSFIGIIAEMLGESRNANAEILVSDKGKIRNIVQRVLQPYTDLNDREFVKVAQKVVADMFDYAVQTNTVFRNRVLNVMISKGGFANDIMQMVREIKSNPNHPLFNNHVINVITPQLAPEASPKSANNIKIKGSTNKVYDQNSIIYSFRELKKYLEGTGEMFKYNKFKMLALYQSGLSVNRLSFTSLLPYEDFEDIYSDTIQKLESLPNIETFANLNVFEKNNWGNDDIVPYEKARWINLKDGTPVYNPAMKYLPDNVTNAVKNGEIPPIMSRGILGRNSNRDFFVYSWEDNISKEQRAEMRKKGDFSYIKRGLFRRVKDVDGQPLIHTSNNREYYIYQAVNAWGARERAQEFYDVEKPSEIDNGFIKVVNDTKAKTSAPREDSVIVNLFTGKGVTATTTPVANKNKPGDLPAIDRTPKSCQ